VKSEEFLPHRGNHKLQISNHKLQTSNFKFQMQLALLLFFLVCCDFVAAQESHYHRSLRQQDTDYSLTDLEAMGFPARALEAVALLTHDPEEPYLSYVARVKENPVARLVKLADLRHNSDLTRIPQPTEKDYARVEKYARAIRLLQE
jgi:hypothetical protein